VNSQAHHPRRVEALLVALALIVSIVVIVAERADAAPPPTSYALSLTADPITGDCVAELSWEGGKGQIYIQMILFNGASDPVASHSQKISTAGDPRGSQSLTHTFNPPGGTQPHVLDVTVKTAKGRWGASGDTLQTISMIGTGETVDCG
jgi:hypothetical protein